MADAEMLYVNPETGEKTRTKLVDLGDGTYALAQAIPQGVTLSGSNVAAAGKKTDADGTDRTIVTTGFNRVILDCTDCTAEMAFAIDEEIAGASKPIYVKAGATLDLPAKGAVLHYSGAGVFRYILL